MKILIAFQAVHANNILKKMTIDAISSIQSEHSWSLFVDDRNISLAIKWNTALDMGKDYDYVFLLNNDIVLYPDTLDLIVKFMEKNLEYLFVSSNQIFEGDAIEYFEEDEIDENKLHWSFVCCRANEVIEKIGYVDTIFERGSFVDTEWEIRARKLSYKICRLLNSRFFHWNDSTHRFLPHYRNVFQDNDLKLRTKWGNSREYVYPYNDPTLPFNFIGEYNGPKTK